MSGTKFAIEKAELVIVEARFATKEAIPHNTEVNLQNHGDGTVTVTWRFPGHRRKSAVVPILGFVVIPDSPSGRVAKGEPAPAAVAQDSTAPTEPE